MVVLLLWRPLTGVLLLVEADELDFGTRRSGPTDADRAGALFIGWKIAPKNKPRIIINTSAHMILLKQGTYYLPKLGRIATWTFGALAPVDEDLLGLADLARVLPSAY